ncbi:MAG TPA: acetolactate synthase AlsS [Pyrinomonadaceae bacterium]
MSNAITKPMSQTGADLLVKSLESQGVEYVFGLPGGKIDTVFDTLVDSRIKTIVCQQEQSAAFMAGAIGRMTGKAGVALVTFSSSWSNLLAGVATTNSEGDPIVAIGGAVPVANRLKLIHRSIDTVSLFRPITKYSVEIDAAAAISKTVANAFRAAESGRPGAAFISAPQDIMTGGANGEVLTPVAPPLLGPAASDLTTATAAVISRAERPVMLLGLLASQSRAAEAVRTFLTKTKIPVVCTSKGAGIVPRELFDYFGGHVGLFHNQPADKLLEAADVVIAVGYNPVEYEPGLWNKGRKRLLIHIDAVSVEIDEDYRPQLELIGDIASTLSALGSEVERQMPCSDGSLLAEISRERRRFAARAADFNGIPIHPIRLVHELQQLLSDDITLCLDTRSFHIWLARHLYSFRARQVLINNGQKSLGVGLPWGIAACLVRPREKVISMSDEGSFVFSAGELETAVRLKCNLVHLVWTDPSYHMMRFQEVARHRRISGDDFRTTDIVRFAKALGAHGVRIESAEQLGPTLKRALEMQGPLVIEIPVDYRHSQKLMKMVSPKVLNCEPLTQTCHSSSMDPGCLNFVGQQCVSALTQN